jgi:outer membrane lipoprotein carrier protein
MKQYVKRAAAVAALTLAALGTPLLASAASAEADPATELGELLTQYDTFAAEFQQYTLSQEGTREEHSTGVFALERPDRFDWHTRTPFEQRIVSDGQYIWIYDPDLEQVTRKPAGDHAISAPALVLNGNVEALKQRFDIRLIDEQADRRVYELLPLESESSFVRIRLLFNGAVLSELLLEDSLGQRTAILLDHIELDPALDPSRFEFVPPEGVDVILDPGV